MFSFDVNGILLFQSTFLPSFFFRNDGGLFCVVLWLSMFASLAHYILIKLYGMVIVETVDRSAWRENSFQLLLLCIYIYRTVHTFLLIIYQARVHFSVTLYVICNVRSMWRLCFRIALCILFVDYFLFSIFGVFFFFIPFHFRSCCFHLQLITVQAIAITTVTALRR